MKYKTLAIILLTGLLAGLGFWFYQLENDQEETIVVNSFAECVAAGNAVMESYPPQCRHGDQLFSEFDLLTSESGTEIRLFTPRAGDEVSSPLAVTGEVPGGWSFEATFPITLLDSRGGVIVESYGQLIGDWMTEEHVQFETELKFADQPTGSKGTLRLFNANPSGLAENAEQVDVEVVF